MLVKTAAVFLGYTKGEFVTEDGEKIEYRNAAFSKPGSADTYQLKVNESEVDPSDLKPYKANFLMIDFRYDSKRKNWKGYIVDVFASLDEMNAAPLDEIPSELMPEAPSPKAAAVAALKKEA